NSTRPRLGAFPHTWFGVWSPVWPSKRPLRIPPFCGYNPASSSRGLITRNYERNVICETAMPTALNQYSSRITQPKSQGASQAMLYATGMTDDDMRKAQVGICANWFEGNPCNMHLNDLAAEVKKGVTQAGVM